MVEKATYQLCDACRRPLRKGEQQRLVNGHSIHNTDECFYAYTVKVEKGILKTAVITPNRNTK